MMPVNKMLESVPFRFLDLPKELRFMIYENLTISTKQLRLLPYKDGLQVQHQTTSLFDDQAAVNITLQTLPVQIFTTSRTVYSESLPFLTRKLDQIRESVPKLSLDSDCLYTNALDSTQKLLRTLLDDLNQDPFSNPKSGTVSLLAEKEEARSQYPSQVQQWLTQTTHLLLSQRPPPCPFSGFMGTRAYPTVRLIVEVSKGWSYTSYRGLPVALHTRVATPLMYTASVTTQLTELWNDLADYTRGLKHVQSGAVVFGQEDERVSTKDALVVKKTVALDFGICRVMP